MRDSWVETTLDKVTESSWGNTKSTKSKYVDSGYLAYSASGADGFLNWFEHDRTAVVLSAIGAQCGKTWFAEGKWTSIKNTIWLKSDNLNLLDKYLFYLSNIEQFWQIRGQAQPFISLGDVKKTKVLLPPLPEQKRIVDLISSVDAYVRVLRTQLENLKIARRAITELLLAEFANAQKFKLKDATSKIGSGATPRGGEAVYLEAGVTLIRSQNVHDFVFVHKGLVAIDEAAARALDGVSVLEDDVLFNITGASVTRSCVVDPEVLPARVNQHVAIIRPLPEVLRSDYLVLLLTSNNMKSFLNDIADSGSTRQALTKQHLENIEIPIPTLADQERIVQLITSMDQLVSTTLHAITETSRLRTGLLSALLSGEHEIPASYDQIMDVA